jgi:hypothetical protein
LQIRTGVYWGFVNWFFSYVNIITGG